MARTAGSHSDITGPRVRDAALRLYAGQGYAAISMRQLAAEVGVQAGALYRYAPDKQSLLFGLMQGHLAAQQAAWDALAKPAGAVAQLEAFARFHIGFQIDHALAVQLCQLERRSLEPDNLAAFDAMVRRYEAGPEAILRQGHSEKLFTFADPQVASQALMAMLSGVGQYYRPDGKLSRDRFERIIWNMARKAVGA